MTKTETRNYQELNLELEEILKKLQSDQTPIDEALKLYEDAQSLITKINKYLLESELKINKLKG